MIDIDPETLKWLAKEGLFAFAIWFAIRMDIKGIHASITDMKACINRAHDRLDILFDKRT